MAYYEQPGRTTTVDKDGKQVTTITFVGDSPVAFSQIQQTVSGVLKNRSVVTDVAGQVRTTFQVEVDVAADGTNAINGSVVVEVVSSVRTVPIEAHPNFAERYLSAADKKKIKDAVQVPDRSPVFEDTGDRARAISLYGYLISGIESYYVPALVIRKTYQASSPPSASQVGKIANPGVSVPGLPRGATFLLINVSARGSTGSYTVTEEYEMSGEGGWDTFLYG